MMEFSHGGRERYHRAEEEQSASRNPTFTPSPSSSSSSSSSSCWVLQGEGREPAAALVAEREHMFDKVVTPSDVGKLNRLVIPKQYAEKYFPLDPTTGEKGLLLCFEEGGTGKPWRFRYSYWNSSQSYVMTKGWSRFVKDKRLDPGDTVSFARGIGESGGGRLFIDWRRRPPDPHRSLLPAAHTMMPLASIAVPWAGSRLFGSPAVNMYGGSSSGGSRGSWGQYRVQLGGHGDGTGGLQPVLDSVPVIRGKAEPKRVRLFGVNLECSEPEDGRQALGSSGDQPQRAVRPKPPLSPLQWRVEPPRTDLKPSTELRLQCKGKEDLQE